MPVERIIKQAETVVIEAETDYINQMMKKYDEADKRPMLQENLQEKIVRELVRQSPKGKFDEEEAILAGLSKFFRRRRKND